MEFETTVNHTVEMSVEIWGWSSGEWWGVVRMRAPGKRIRLHTESMDWEESGFWDSTWGNFHILGEREKNYSTKELEKSPKRQEESKTDDVWGQSVFQEQKCSTILHDFIVCFSLHSQRLLDLELFFKLNCKLCEEENHAWLAQGYILSAVNGAWQRESLIRFLNE